MTNGKERTCHPNPTGWWPRLCRNMGWWSRAQNDIDHGKMWATIVLVFLMVAIALNLPKLSIGFSIVLVSAAYGRSMWTRFLESKSVTSSESVQTQNLTQTQNINRTSKVEQSLKVDANRDVTLGVQPWAGMGVPMIVPGMGGFND